MSDTINRHIPFPVKCGVLFGGVYNIGGWLFLGLGLIIYWHYAFNIDLSFLHFTGNIIKTNGKVIDSFELMDSDDDEPIFETHYKFKTSEGVEFEDFSYSTGFSISKDKIIRVEYPEGNPQYSRVEGLRREAYGPNALFVLLFPVAGLILIFTGSKKSIIILKLLKSGQLAHGKLVSKEQLDIKVNDDPVYKLTFQFKDELGNTYHISEKTHMTYVLEDDDTEKLLYMKDNPDCATMIDSIPSSPVLDEAGNVSPSSTAHSLMPAILPLLTIVGHGMYAAVRFIL